MVTDDFVFAWEERIIFRDFSNVLSLSDCILFVETFQNWDWIFLQLKHLVIEIFDNTFVVSSRKFIPDGKPWRSLSLLLNTIQIVSKNVLACFYILDRPQNWESLDLRIQFKVWSIQERDKFEIRIIRMWNHRSNLIIDVPCWRFIKLFAAGQSIATCYLEHIVQDEIDVIIITLWSRLQQQTVFIDQNSIGYFQRKLFGLDQFKEPLFNFRINIQVSQALQIVQNPQKRLFSLGILKSMIFKWKRSQIVEFFHYV